MTIVFYISWNWTLEIREHLILSGKYFLNKIKIALSNKCSSRVFERAKPYLYKGLEVEGVETPIVPVGLAGVAGDGGQLVSQQA